MSYLTELSEPGGLSSDFNQPFALFLVSIFSQTSVAQYLHCIPANQTCYQGVPKADWTVMHCNNSNTKGGSCIVCMACIVDHINTPPDNCCDKSTSINQAYYTPGRACLKQINSE